MSVLIKHMAIPKGCIYANDKDQTEYCPLLNHDDVPFCQYIENEPEIAIGIDERPVYCPLFDVSESCQDTVSRAAAIDAIIGCANRKTEHELRLFVRLHGLGDSWSGGIVDALDAIYKVPSALPDLDEWCTDCKEYDKERNSCPRWNRVIKETLKDLQEERKTQLSEESTTSDYINRCDAIDAVRKNTFRLTFAEEQNCEGHVAWSANAVYSDVIEGALLELPSAQPERKKGKWIPQDHNKTNGIASTLVYYYPKCSVCGHCDNYTNFCSNCGADMRGEQDG